MNGKSFRDILVFLLVNMIGFLSPSICYYAGVLSGMVVLGNPLFDPQSFRTWFFAGVMMTWLVCGVFSLAFFFIRGQERWFFALAPAIVPIVYGLSVLARS